MFLSLYEKIRQSMISSTQLNLHKILPFKHVVRIDYGGPRELARTKVFLMKTEDYFESQTKPT